MVLGTFPFVCDQCGRMFFFVSPFLCVVAVFVFFLPLADGTRENGPGETCFSFGTGNLCPTGENVSNWYVLPPQLRVVSGRGVLSVYGADGANLREVLAPKSLSWSFWVQFPFCLWLSVPGAVECFTFCFSVLLLVLFFLFHFLFAWSTARARPAYLPNFSTRLPLPIPNGGGHH